MLGFLWAHPLHAGPVFLCRGAGVTCGLGRPGLFRAPGSRSEVAGRPADLARSGHCFDVDRLAQCVDLVNRQEAPFSRLKGAQGYGPEARSLQLQRRVAYRGQHQSYLALLPLVYGHAQPGVLAVAPRLLYLRGGCLLPFNFHAIPQPLNLGMGQSPARQGAVFLVDAKTRVGESKCQVAIVGKQQQAGGIDVQPADRVDPYAALTQVCRAEHVEHSWPAVSIARGCHDALGFVEGNVDELLVSGRRFGRANRFAVDLDSVLFRVGPHAHFFDYLPVDLHPTLGDHLFGGPARGNSR